jgi:succinyl-CoA synthetase beta subunit
LNQQTLNKKRLRDERAVTTLSETKSKELLTKFGLTTPHERIVSTSGEAAEAAESIGFPVVAKLCGDAIAHKTERGLVRLGLNSAKEVTEAAESLFRAATPADGAVQVLLAQMVRGRREFIAGVVRDPAFGPCVMLGVGGILAEAVEDVVFRVAPLSERDAFDMIEDLGSQKLLGAFRGEPEVDRGELARVLVGLSSFVMSRDDVESVDCNPLIIVDGRPVLVDALVEVRS